MFAIFTLKEYTLIQVIINNKKNMGNFNRDKRSDRPQMHKAVCDECGKSCEVPFKPSGDKPIYCSDCFKDKGGDSKKSDRRDFGGRDSRQHSMHRAVCDSCGKSCEVPFKPTSGKPIYCDNCFGDKGGKRDHGKSRDRGRDRDRGGKREQSSKQLYILNEKLDKILKILSTSEPKKEVKVEKKPKKAEVEKKTEKVKKTAVKKTEKKKPAAKKATKKKPVKKKAKAKKKK